MAKKLTKYVSAQTIVTADVANSLFGGLFGSTEGDALDALDPKVAGHVHDGQHCDGHAQKINLVDHVTDQLRNVNLADDAVTKRNVASFTDPSLAIPVSETIGPDTFYFLDINTFPGGAFELNPPGTSVEGTPPDVVSNVPGDLTADDFAFGSDSIDDDGNSDHDNRVIFDKSKAAFRAGTATEDQWDDPNRGTNSVGFGLNNKAIGDLSFVHGLFNEVSGVNSAVLSGQVILNAGISSGVLSGRDHVIDGASLDSGIGSGRFNRLVATAFSFVTAGNDNEISSSFSFIGAGQSNEVASESSGVGTGTNNSISGTSNSSFIGSGNNNIISVLSPQSFIGSGESNLITDGSSLSFIGSGDNNSITNSENALIVSGSENIIDFGSTTSSSDYNLIVGGLFNKIHDNTFDGLAPLNVIVGGSSNLIERNASSDMSRNAIVGGGENIIRATGSFIGSGLINVIDQGDSEVEQAVIAGGSGNMILGDSLITNASASRSSILGGRDNIIRDSSYASIIGGQGNEFDTTGVGLIFPFGFNWATILGGAFNRVNLTGFASSVRGLAGRGYMYNQNAHGGGGWDDPTAPAGQAQTSVLVVSREITAADAEVTLRLSGDDLTPFNLYVPVNTCVFAKASWIVRHDDPGAGTHEARAGERWAIFKREGILSPATLVAEGDILASSGDAAIPITPSWHGLALGLVNFRVSVGVGSAVPARAVARVEWTQVFQDIP